jgi:hypothetical protein
MKINYLSLKPDVPAHGYWDMTFLHNLLFDLGKTEREVFFIPGANQGDVIPQINEVLAQYPKIAVFVTSDEEGKFDISKLSHPDMIVYSQYGNSENNLPLGYTPDTRPVLADIGLLPKEMRWFFSGQITHERRKQMMNQLVTMSDGMFVGTDGFSKGMGPWEYYSHIASSRAVICPPGAVTQDSFRVYETLEAGAIPIVDKFSSQGNGDYWEKLFPDAPFPIISEYSQIPDVLDIIDHQYYANKVFAWWIAQKQQIKDSLKRDLGAKRDNMTVVISTSPIPSHPSTKIIDETIKSIRHHLGCKIIITIDGVRKEQTHMKPAYEQYIRKLLWKCNFEYSNVVPVIFEKHMHQSGMLREVLRMIDTPLMMYVEHDTPLVTDRFIDWNYLKKVLLRKEAYCIRFHFEEIIPEEHKYLMIGEPEDDLQRTAQWSQRPHIARTDFYRNISKFFSEESNCFIEDLIYGHVVGAYQRSGIEGWKRWRLFIYHPSGGIKRSLNLDGRDGGEKYEKEQKW